ncbi:MAG: TolC family outer membrane protein [Rhodospirillales bacterium]|nr:TolC family outer membrane protein [Rhodospirillales bacterium]
MRNWLVAFLVLSLAAPLWARPAAAQTLEEALAAAYALNPRLAAERARLRATDEEVPQALSNWRPTVEAFGVVGKRWLDGNNHTVFGAENQDLLPRNYGAQITQPLFRGGQTIAQTRAAENSVRAGRAQLDSIEQQVLLNAVTAYMDVYRDQAVLDLQIRNEQRLARQLEATRDRFQVGEVTRTDVFQAEARLAGATAARVGAEGALERSRATYRNVVGQVPGLLAQPSIPRDLPNTLDQAVTTAKRQNPDILSAEFVERSSLDTVDQVRGELLPSMNLQGTAQRDHEATFEGARTDELAALININVPLYESGAVYSRLRQSKQNVVENRKLLDQTRQDAVEAATSAWNNLQTARAALTSFRKAVQANDVALEGVQREAEVGARTVLDVLDAEQELVDSQVNLVRAQRDEIVATFTLKTAIGELNARALALPVEYYDPTVHYDEVRNRWFGSDSVGGVNDSFPLNR